MRVIGQGHGERRRSNGIEEQDKEGRKYNAARQQRGQHKSMGSHVTPSCHSCCAREATAGERCAVQSLSGSGSSRRWDGGEVPSPPTFGGRPVHARPVGCRAPKKSLAQHPNGNWKDFQDNTLPENKNTTTQIHKEEEMRMNSLGFRDSGPCGPFRTVGDELVQVVYQYR